MIQAPCPMSLWQRYEKALMFWTFLWSNLAKNKHKYDVFMHYLDCISQVVSAHKEQDSPKKGN